MGTTRPVGQQIAERDFTTTTRKALAKRGVTLTGTTAIPGTGAMPYANPARGYSVNDNGLGRLLTHFQVLERAALPIIK